MQTIQYRYIFKRERNNSFLNLEFSFQQSKKGQI